MDIPGQEIQNFVLVTHGLVMRIFCLCYVRWTNLEFEQVWNPANCEIWVLEKTSSGRYCLKGRYENKSWVPIKFGVDQAQPLFEHMKEPQTFRLMVPGSDEELEDDALRDLRKARLSEAAEQMQRSNPKLHSNKAQDSKRQLRD